MIGINPGGVVQVRALYILSYLICTCIVLNWAATIVPLYLFMKQIVFCFRISYSFVML